MEGIRIDLFQGITSHIVISVTGGGCETGGVHPVFLHGGNDFRLIVLRCLIDLLETIMKGIQNLFTQRIDFI